jgi:hypothetical protein
VATRDRAIDHVFVVEVGQIRRLHDSQGREIDQAIDEDAIEQAAEP